MLVVCYFKVQFKHKNRPFFTIYVCDTEPTPDYTVVDLQNKHGDF